MAEPLSPPLLSVQTGSRADSTLSTSHFKGSWNQSNINSQRARTMGCLSLLQQPPGEAANLVGIES